MSLSLTSVSISLISFKMNAARKFLFFHFLFYITFYSPSFSRVETLGTLVVAASNATFINSGVYNNHKIFTPTPFLRGFPLVLSVIGAYFPPSINLAIIYRHMYTQVLVLSVIRAYFPPSIILAILYRHMYTQVITFY